MKRLSARLVSMLAVAFALVAGPAQALPITVGDFSFIDRDPLTGASPELVVNNLSGGTGVDDDFITIDITLVDSGGEYDYGYDASGVFVAGAPSSYLVVGPGASARFLFDDFLLNPADFFGAFVTVQFRGEALTTWDGTPGGLLVLEDGNLQLLEYNITAVPEPATMLLVGAGAALIGGLRRRRVA